MTETGGEEAVDELEQRIARSGAVKEAWTRTVEDMRSMADERREAGWDVVTLPAGNTAPTSRDAGDDDRFGLVYVVAKNHAEAFVDAFEAGEFPRYEAYRNEINGFVFLVTELLDPETETAIMLAGQYELQHAPGMVKAATDEGVLYTHVEKLDGTVLGSFRHEEFEPLVPDVEQLESWHDRPSPSSTDDE